jgi:uncharacterized protein YjbI with pentapeptide repeats
MLNKRPRTTGDALYQLLRDGNISDFNARRAAGHTTDLTNCDLRCLDLRGIDADGLDFSHSYLRQADLRGVDFRKSCLEGASLNKAQISGAYFPDELTAEEIHLSVVHGTRMRYRHSR